MKAANEDDDGDETMSQTGGVPHPEQTESQGPIVDSKADLPFRRGSSPDVETAVEGEPQDADPQIKYDEPARNSGDFNEDEVDYGGDTTVDELVTKVRDELIKEEGGGGTYDSTIVAYVPEFQAASLYELQPAECIDNSPDQMVAIAMRQVVRLAKSRVNWDRSSDEVRRERGERANQVRRGDHAPP